MKIYWRSKENAPPPPGARFSLYPFSSNAPLRFSETIPFLPHPTPPIPILKRCDLPTRSEWIRLVEEALASIETGEIEKVVLARKTTLTLFSSPNPFQIAAAINATGATLYCADFENGRAFLGASPERLFQRKEKMFHTEAVAGTRKHHLEHELLQSAKELQEHRYVQDYLQHQIPSLQFSPIIIHKTANLSHLYSRGAALIDKPDEELIAKLHPTPALCGTPKQAAFETIRSLEPFSRNFYGGVIGWQTDTESDWVVAIRCCEIDRTAATLYAGTGIVKGSDPEKEWDELDAKLSLYKEIFQCGL